ncbi:MAG: succinylglutamate desuccinylase/aspartoacylase family protein [Patescibacteria group bacterium]
MNIVDHDDIFSAEGSAPGLSVLIVGGTHGNERTGIEIVKQLREDLRSGKRSVSAGTLTLILANQMAIAENVRAVGGRDMNRLYSAEARAHDNGSYEFRRTITIAEYIRHADVVIDIHAMNIPSIPFVASKNDQAHQNVFRWFEPKNVLIDPQYIFGGGVPVATDEYADSLGKVGLCFEAGWVGDAAIFPAIMESTIRYITDVGIFSGEKVSPPEFDGAMYEILEAVLRDDRSFVFADNRGTSSFDPIRRGDLIGHCGQDAVFAPCDGIIVFPVLPEHQTVGKPVCYLAKRVK